jgi:hypothetical protein
MTGAIAADAGGADVVSLIFENSETDMNIMPDRWNTPCAVFDQLKLEGMFGLTLQFLAALKSERMNG